MIYCCSVCYGVEHPRTLVQGTVICTKCLEETKKSQEITLEDRINEAVSKENDIYD